MSMNYIPMSTPDVASTRVELLTPLERDIPDNTLADTETDIPTVSEENLLRHPEDPTGTPSAVNEVGTDYLPTIGVASSFDDTTHDITDAAKATDGTEDPLLQTNDTPPDEETSDILNPDKTMNYVPATVVDYYTESAMSAKARNKLPSEEFGIPRIRAYPLNDEKHVRMAISMFSHCKNPKDREQLASRIFAKIDEYKMDVTIGKDSELYSYAPKTLQESALGLDQVIELDTEKPHESKIEKYQQKLRFNMTACNNLFYGNIFTKTIQSLREYQFLDYFYPNLRTHNLYTRKHCACGGLLMSDIDPRELNGTEFDEFILSNYNARDNWFCGDLGTDLVHLSYCIQLYALLEKILLKADFRIDDLTDLDVQIMLDWREMVQYHYSMLKEQKPYSPTWVNEIQYLFDLCWNPLENPEDPDVISSNVVSFVDQMVTATNIADGMNESTELMSRFECTNYLVTELGYTDDLFLLPDTLEYPILNRGSVRMAMDMITTIPEADRKTYVTNLNRKYKELGCTFSISVDHPYAQYADKEIINNMVMILMEGDTCVDDAGTSAESDGTVTATDPWYKKFDVTDTTTKNILSNKELGPNMKEFKDANYVREESLT